jgi:L-amino acid N-acyltransferase YncA
MHGGERMGWMQLRMLEAGDLEPLAKMYTYYATRTVFTYYSREATVRYMRSLFSGAGHACAVGVVEGRVVGYVHISPCDERKNCCSLAVYLEEACTGRGRGETLVRHGEALAARMGYGGVGVAICTENERSRKLFERLGYGFVCLRRAEAVKFGRVLDTNYYHKTLGAGDETAR